MGDDAQDLVQATMLIDNEGRQMALVQESAAELRALFIADPADGGNWHVLKGANGREVALSTDAVERIHILNEVLGIAQPPAGPPNAPMGPNAKGIYVPGPPGSRPA